MRRFIILGLGGVFAIASFASNETMAAPEGSVFHALAPLAGVAREAPPAMADEQLAAVEGGFVPGFGFFDFFSHVLSAIDGFCHQNPSSCTKLTVTNGVVEVISEGHPGTIVEVNGVQVIGPQAAP